MVNFTILNIKTSKLVIDITINKCNNSVVELVESLVSPYFDNPRLFADDLLKNTDRYGSNIQTQGDYKVLYIQND